MYITTEVHKNTAHCIQQAVISFIIMAMGDGITKIGGGNHPNLRKHCKEAADLYLPNKSKAHQMCRRWVMHYLQYGETPVETAKWKKTTLRGGERRHWTAHDTTKLKAIIGRNLGLYLDELVKKLEAQTKARWASSTIWKKLREELGYSLQHVAEKALEQDNEDRLSYQIALESAVDRPEQLVYIDESQIGRNAARRNRWWSPRGRTPQRLTRFDFEVKRQYTLIAACDVNGFIHEACDIVLRGNNAQEEINNPLIGTVGTERVELWVERCLVPILGNYSRGEPRSIVVMDNATVHHSKKIQDLITNAGALLLYLAPYSPDKNSAIGTES
jgi:hypothetical protein